MIVTVSHVDFVVASSIGYRRALAFLHMKRNGGNSHAHDPVFDQAINGAVAEQIVAQLLGVEWRPKIGELSKGDIGAGIEVRCRNPYSGDEIGIRDHELKPTPYVLVLQRGGYRFEVAGWVHGIEAQERGVWNDKRQCFFVPRPYREIDELIELVKRAEAA